MAQMTISVHELSEEFVERSHDVLNGPFLGPRQAVGLRCHTLISLTFVS